MLRRYAGAKALFAFTRHLQPIPDSAVTQSSCDSDYRDYFGWFAGSIGQPDLVVPAKLIIAEHVFG
jgi:hypothetical protein